MTPRLDWGAVAVSPDERFLAAVAHGGVVTLYPVEEGSPKPFPELAGKYLPVGWGKSGLFLRETHRPPPVPIIQFDTETGTQQLLTNLVPRQSTGMTLVRPIRVSPDGKGVAYNYEVYQSTLLMLDFSQDRR